MRSETASPYRETATLKLQAICHRTNVADTSHSEIKANRVRAPRRHTRHCSTGKIDMQIYAQILVILLTRPAALATAQRVDGIYPLTSSPPSHLLSTQFLSLRSPSYSLARSTQFLSIILSAMLISAARTRSFPLGVLSLRSRAATGG